MAGSKTQFGTFAFPAGFALLSQDGPRDVAAQELPRLDGASVQVARDLARKLVIAGTLLIGSSADDMQAAVDALRAGVASRSASQLWVGRDNRYINAQLVSVTESYALTDSETSWKGAGVRIECQFLAADPRFYSATAGVPDAPTVAALDAPGVSNVTPGGGSNADTWATWMLTIGASGAGTISLTNGATGESCLLGSGGQLFGAGDVIVLARNAQGTSITLAGAPAAGLCLGMIPRLIAGANTVTIALTPAAGSALSLATASAAYLPAYQSS